MTRGVKHQVDQFITGLQSQFFPYGKVKEDGTRELVQLAVRPIQLWELVFPKEHMNTVLKTVGYPPVKDWKSKYMMALRLMLKAKPVPGNIDMSKVPMRPIQGICVGTELIGMREDKIWPEKGTDGTPNKYAGHEQL